MPFHVLHDDTEITDKKTDKTSQKNCASVSQSGPRSRLCPPTAPPPSYQTSQGRRDASPSEDDKPGPSSLQPEQHTPDSTQSEEGKRDPLVVPDFSPIASRTRQVGKFGTAHHLHMIEVAGAQGAPDQKQKLKRQCHICHTQWTLAKGSLLTCKFSAKNLSHLSQNWNACLSWSAAQQTGKRSQQNFLPVTNAEHNLNGDMWTIKIIEQP